MKLYRFCDISIQSNIDLFEVDPNKLKEPDYTFKMYRGNSRRATSSRWSRHRREDGQILLSYARKKSHSIIRFPGGASFIISADEKSITSFANRKVSEDTVRHLLLDHVLPRILARRGSVLIHASSVRFQNRAVAFMGDSGAGKSTIAAAFHRLGVSVLSDDCLMLQQDNNRIFAIPSYLSLRLWPDSVNAVLDNQLSSLPVTNQSSKVRLLLSPAGSSTNGQKLPLNCIYYLDPAPVSTKKIRFKSISKRDATLILAKNSFQLGGADLNSMDKMFTSFEQVIGSVPFYSLSFCRRFDNLDNVCKAIMGNLNV